MKLSGLHLLLTYQCTFECDHCFVWGSPRQSGVMSLDTIRLILNQARQMETVRTICFEGGEPFLYYATLLQGVREAAAQGFQVGIVTNTYWATSEEDALAALRPLAGLVQSITLSSDLFHFSEFLSRQSKNASQAASQLGIATSLISIARPEVLDVQAATGEIPPGESGVMYRGRAALKLAGRVPHRPWATFDRCPHENLTGPGRVHLDPFGFVHICQGIAIGNFFQRPLEEIADQYSPADHPIASPLLAGGPAELARRYQLTPSENYADACHLCYETRCRLRGQFPEILAPQSMYFG